MILHIASQGYPSALALVDLATIVGVSLSIILLAFTAVTAYVTDEEQYKSWARFYFIMTIIGIFFGGYPVLIILFALLIWLGVRFVRWLFTNS